MRSLPEIDTNFKAYYPKTPDIKGVADEISRIGGDQLVFGTGYGSAFSGDASKDSLMDLLLIVRNPWTFYRHAAKLPEVKLGTTRMPGFHAEWNQIKGNFYPATLYLPGSVRNAKIWVIPLDELPKHAQGASPDAADGKGGLYLAGRMQKAMFPVFVDNATPDERAKIDWSFNKARIDGVWLALGLMPEVFDFDHLAGTFVDLSYAADKRIEKAGKSLSLYNKNKPDYREMLTPILVCFAQNAIFRLEGKDKFVKLVSPDKPDVETLLKQCASMARSTNFFKNPITFGIPEGIVYGFKKVMRARS